jgi:hypothetical protein
MDPNLDRALWRIVYECLGFQVNHVQIVHWHACFSCAGGRMGTMDAKQVHVIRLIDSKVGGVITEAEWADYFGP